MKKITIDLYFSDDFVPQEKFDNNGYGSCVGCPFAFYDTEYKSADGCSIGGDDECPIKKYFEDKK